MDKSILQKVDPELYDVITKEKEREETKLRLIASENYVSTAVLVAQATTLGNKYAEGYPGKRYYQGCEWVDIAEALACTRAKKLFGAEHANVQLHSGSQANMAVYMAVLKPGDMIMGMSLSAGGHLTHGYSINFSGKVYKSVAYGVDSKTETIDFQEVRDMAKKYRPKMIIAGGSAYPRTIDFSIFRTIADEVGAYLTVDMAHIAGLIAAGVHPDPVPLSDFVTSSTHKTLRGPRGGLVLTREKYANLVDDAVFPGIQGGPAMNIIAAKAVCFLEALQPEFKKYQQQIVKNAKKLAEEFLRLDFRLVSGGTDNHLLLLDLGKKKLSGKQAAEALDRAGITVNKNRVPFDRLGAAITSGIRIGTPAVTTRGMKEPEMSLIASFVSRVLTKPDDEKNIGAVREEVMELCRKFPLNNIA